VVVVMVGLGGAPATAWGGTTPFHRAAVGPGRR
jgi:hypothetical protein